MTIHELELDALAQREPAAVEVRPHVRCCELCPTDAWFVQNGHAVEFGYQANGDIIPTSRASDIDELLPITVCWSSRS